MSNTFEIHYGSDGIDLGSVHPRGIGEGSSLPLGVNVTTTFWGRCFA
jgi:hypothetical protein